MKPTKPLLIGLILALVALLLLGLWVMLDSTFIVRGDEINLITNPNFDDPERGFEGWNVGGCMTYVRPPKEGAAKAGPVTFDGGCNPGETAVISQTIQLSGTNVLTYTHREILKGVGNHIIVTISDGNGWQRTVRDTFIQNSCFCYTPAYTVTLPINTTQVILEIEAVYQNSIGNKITAVTVTGN